MRYVLGCVHAVRKMTGGVFDEPVEPPIEKPEEPTTPPSIEDLFTIKINDEVMAVVGTNDWRAIAYGNGQYVAYGYTSNESSKRWVSTSVDGITWTTPKSANIQFSRIIFANGKFVGVDSSNSIATSTNGLNWTIKTTTVPSGTGAFHPTDVAYGNGKFVVISRGSGYFATSLDGLTWNIQKNNNMSGMYAITYANDMFVVCGNKAVYTSEDGETWTVSKVDEFIVDQKYGWGCTQWAGIVYGNGKLVAAGSDGMAGFVWVSEDGINWSAPTKMSNVNWYDIVYSNGLFVVCGSNGYISFSTDGMTWTTKEKVKDEAGNTISSFLYGIVAMPAK